MVIHITDGESQEGDPLPYAELLRDLQTADGNVLLFNFHLAAQPLDPFMFPNSGEYLPDDLARQLFEMSSVLPDRAFALAVAQGHSPKAGARGMAFNGAGATLVSFLEIVTRFP